ISFEVSVSQPPLDDVANVAVCDTYVLPALTYGTYYTGPNATGTVLNAGDEISSNQTIYVFNGTPGDDCFHQTRFTVPVIPPPAPHSSHQLSFTVSVIPPPPID